MSPNRVKKGCDYVSPSSYFLVLLDEIEKQRRLRTELDSTMTDGWYDVIEAEREGRVHHTSLDSSSYLRQEIMKSRLRIVPTISETTKEPTIRVANLEDDAETGLLNELEQLQLTSNQKKETKNTQKQASDQEPTSEDEDEENKSLRQRKHVSTPQKQSKQQNDLQNEPENKEQELSKPKSTVYDNSEDILKWFSLVPNAPMKTAQDHFVKALHQATALHEHRLRLCQIVDQFEQSLKEEREENQTQTQSQNQE